MCAGDPNNPLEGLDLTAQSCTCPAKSLEPIPMSHVNLYEVSVKGRSETSDGSQEVCIGGMTDLCQQAEGSSLELEIHTQEDQSSPQKHSSHPQ